MSTQPRDGAGGGTAAMRGFLLIGVGVLIGAALLINSYSGTSTGPLDTSSKPPSGTGHGATSTTGVGGSTTVPTPVSHPPASVKVLVLNGSGKSGVAKTGADALKPAGFTTLDPTNAKSNVTTSVVYAAPGFEADAIAVAGLLGLPPTVVKPLTVPPPPEVGDPADAAVVAVLGPDSAAAGATTTAPPAN